MTRRVVRRRPFSAAAIAFVVFLVVLGLGTVAAVYRPFALGVAVVVAVGVLIWLRERPRGR